ncbi:MAG: hypothetical protein ACE5FF_06200 [Saprospiraceae bacterium]
MKNKVFKILTLFLFLTLASPRAEAQCPMCRMSAESNLKAGGTMGRGLNTGILFLFAMPYLMAGTLGFIWWKNKRKEDEMEA